MTRTQETTVLLMQLEDAIGKARKAQEALMEAHTSPSGLTDDQRRRAMALVGTKLEEAELWLTKSW